MNKMNKVEAESQLLFSSREQYQSEQSLFSGSSNLLNTPIQEENFIDVDPAQGLSRVSQAEKNLKISDQVITPFDSGQLVQTLNMPGREVKVMTVTFVAQNVHQAGPEVPSTKENRLMKCQIEGCDLRLEPHNKDRQSSEKQLYCDYVYCKSSKTPLRQNKDASYFFCPRHNYFATDNNITTEICADCFSDHFVRKSLQNKTSNHGKFEAFDFQSDREVLQQSRQQDMNLSVVDNIINHETGQQISRRLYGNAKPPTNLGYKQEPLQNSSYALLGLWVEHGQSKLIRDKSQSIDSAPDEDLDQKQINSQFKCYQQFRIDNPLLIDRPSNGKDLVQQDFIFLSDDNKSLFYFTKKLEQIEFNTCVIEDLPHYMRQECLYEPNLFSFPAEKCLVPTDLGKPFKELFEDHSGELVEPRLVGNTLCVRSFSEEAEGFRFDFLNWQECNREFTIDASYLLKAVVNDANKVQSIWIIHKDEIKHLKYSSSLEESPEVLAQYRIPDVQLETYFKKNKVTAKMHSFTSRQDTHVDRVTIIVEGVNWFTYQLDHESQSLVDWMPPHEAIGDSAFVKDFTTDSSAYMVSYITPYEHKVEVQENQYTINIYNLNTDREISFSSFNTASYRKLLHFTLKNNIGSQDIPKKWMAYNKIEDDVYSSQVFYQDFQSGSTNVLFFTAQEITETKYKLKPIAPWILFEREQCIEYPILVYTTPHPMRNQLMLCNLTKNKTQMKLHLNVSFICFVEAGPYNSPDQSINCIYFLGQNSKNQVHLYEIQTEAWRSIDDDHVKLSRVDWQIQLNSQHQLDQIRTAELFRLYNGQEMILIVQFEESIVQFNSNHTRVPVEPLFMKDADTEMAPIRLARGFFNFCFFVIRKIEGDEIHCIFFNPRDDQMQVKCVRAQKNRILQLQMNSQLHPFKQEKNKLKLNQIFILDDSKTLHLMGLQDRQIDYDVSDIKIEDLQSWDLSGLHMKRVFRALEKLPWQTCILTELAIICSLTIIRVQDSDKKVQNETIKKSCIYSTTLKHHKQQDFTGFIDQNKTLTTQITAQIKKDGDITKEMDKKISNLQICHGTYPIRNCGRMLTVMQEHHKSYFVTSATITTRRVDLISFSMQKILNYNYYVLTDVILVDNKAGCFLVFDQQYRMLRAIHQGNILQIHENSNSDQKMVEISNKAAKTKIICTFNEKGEQVDPIDKKQLYSTVDGFAGPHNKQIVSHFTQEVEDPNTQAKTLVKEISKFNHLDIIFYRKKPIIVQNFAAKLDENAPDWKLNNKLVIIGVVEKDYEIFSIQKFIFKSDAMNRLRIAITPDYLIINLEDVVWFTRRANIQLFDKDLKLSQYMIDMQRIEIDKMFNSYHSFSQGISLMHVNDYDLIMFNHEKDKQKSKNIIQISIKDRAIVWDLELDHEISTLYNIQDFLKCDTFVRTGFRYYHFSGNSPKDTMIKSAVVMNCNHNCTLVSIEETIDDMSICFRLYSALEIYWMAAIEKILVQDANRISVDHLTPQLYTTNFYGDSFFTQFYLYPHVLDLCFNQVHEMDINWTNENNSSDTFIRQLFFILNLPFKQLKDSSAMKLAQQQNRTIERNATLWRQKYLPCLNNKKQSSAQVKPEKPVMSILYQKQIFNKETQRVRRDGKRNLGNLTQYLIQNDDPAFEKLVKLQLLSDEIQLKTLVQSFDDFKCIFKVQSEMINNYMESAHIETPMTKEVNLFRWSTSQKMVVFQSNTAQLDVQSIKNRIKQVSSKEDGWLLRRIADFRKPKHRFIAVKIRVIEVDWLKGNVANLYKFVSKQPEALYENELIKVLLNQQMYKWAIFAQHFLPFLAHMVATLYYYFEVIPVNFDGNYDVIYGWQAWCARLLVFTSTIYLMSTEVMQVVFLQSQYFDDLWNLINNFSPLVNALIIGVHTSAVHADSHGVEKGGSIRLVHYASFASVLLWISFSQWMRLFPETAYYVNLITQTISDMRLFLLFYIMVLFLFLDANIILDKYLRMEHEAHGEGYAPITSQKLVDNDMGLDNHYTLHFATQFVAQYLVGLAEFEQQNFDNYKKSTSTEIIWLYFIAATFMTNIVFLNMLIAIMGDTFQKISQNKETQALKQQTQLNADFIFTLRKNVKVNDSKYLFIVTPEDYSEGQALKTDWQGGVPLMKKKLGNLMNTAQSFINNNQKVNKKEFSQISQSMRSIREIQKKLNRQMFQVQTLDERNHPQYQSSTSRTMKTLVKKNTSFTMKKISSQASQPQVQASQIPRLPNLLSTESILATVEEPPLATSARQTDFALIKDLMENLQTNICGEINPRLEQMQEQITRQKAEMETLEQKVIQNQSEIPKPRDFLRVKDSNQNVFSSLESDDMDLRLSNHQRSKNLSPSSLTVRSINYELDQQL